MCKTRHYPPPDKTKKQYTKPVALPFQKLKELDSDLKLLLDKVSVEEMKSCIAKLTSYHTRHSKSIYINDVANWLNNEFIKMGYDDVSYHQYTENISGTNVELKNVICKKHGTTDKTILICA
ncbi:MAG TPA: hypothetical protein VFD60_14420, partial [Nitrososphaeraceae archaeon]|nr:hypothetical protein [Nitrososphaeraceae archaeon]